jgi:hypothetical protein
VIEFVYDGLGRRTITRINGQGVRYVYDGYNIIQERDERTDELITEYTYLQGNVFKQKRGTEERWFYNQPEGGYPNHVFSVDGTKTDSLDFGWFGELAYHRGETQIALGWAGGWVFAQYSDMPFVLIPESNEVWLPKVAKSLNPLVRSSWGMSVDAGTGLSSYTGACEIPVRYPERETGTLPAPYPNPIRRPNMPGLTVGEADAELKLTDSHCNSCNSDNSCGTDCAIFDAFFDQIPISTIMNIGRSTHNSSSQEHISTSCVSGCGQIKGSSVKGYEETSVKYKFTLEEVTNCFYEAVMTNLHLRRWIFGGIDRLIELATIQRVCDEICSHWPDSPIYGRDYCNDCCMERFRRARDAAQLTIANYAKSGLKNLDDKQNCHYIWECLKDNYDVYIDEDLFELCCAQVINNWKLAVVYDGLNRMPNAEEWSAVCGALMNNPKILKPSGGGQLCQSN